MTKYDSQENETKRKIIKFECTQTSVPIVLHEGAHQVLYLRFIS